MEQNANSGGPLGAFVLLSLGAWVVSELFKEPKDTVNYTLFHKGRVVYEGICYEDRFGKRLREHTSSGKIFDDYKKSRLKKGSVALDHERMRIRRIKPKYNIHHNC